MAALTLSLKTLLSCTLLTAFLFCTTAYSADKIDSVKASFHVGEKLMVCGDVAKTSKLRKSTALNLGAAYPNEHIAITVWDEDLPGFTQKFGSLESLTGQRICAVGKIVLSKDHLYLSVKNPQLLRLMKN